MIINQVVVGSTSGPVPSADLWSLLSPVGLNSTPGDIASEFILPEVKSAHASKLSDPNALSGAQVTNTIQGSNDWWYRTFLQYDLSQIMGLEVTKAELFHYANSWSDSTGVGTTNMSRVLADWDETKLSWNNQPSTTGTYMTTSVNATPLNTWGAWDVTNLVDEWANNTYPNYGMYVKNNNEGAYRVNWTIRNRKYGDGTYATYIKAVCNVPGIIYERYKELIYGPINILGAATIVWSATTPTGTDVTVEYSVGVIQNNWLALSNGDTFTADGPYCLKITLTTEDVTKSPVIEALSINKVI